MEFEFSKHALEQMIRRDIDEDLLKSIVEMPNNVVDQDITIKIYTKEVNENSKNYLYRVFVNCVRNPALIITVYKTSKTKKYVNKI